MSETTWSLRPATESDLEKIVAIESKVHVAPWNLEHFRAELDKPYSRLLVMTDDETDEQIAGYIVAWLMFDECQILNLAVDLPYRGLGFAKKMIQKIIQQAIQKNLNRVTLDVRKGNLPAIQLYQSNGFVILQVRKAFYSNGEDAYMMGLAFNSDGIPF